MGLSFAPLYGNVDLGSAIEDIEKVVALIKTNKYSKADIIKLYEANAELIKALLENENKD